MLDNRLSARSTPTQPATAVHVAGQTIGGPAFTVIAGPCSVEGRDMLLSCAAAVRAAGARLLRGGAFKPRSSPYAFRGLGTAALEMLAEARDVTGMPVVTELMDARGHRRRGGGRRRHPDWRAQHAEFLSPRRRGRTPKAGLPQARPLGHVQELLLAAEHVMAQGNTQVILCERGIRTFETSTRNTLDISAVPVLKQETHLPVIVDPSHAAGRRISFRPSRPPRSPWALTGCWSRCIPIPRTRSPTARSRSRSTRSPA